MELPQTRANSELCDEVRHAIRVEEKSGRTYDIWLLTTFDEETWWAWLPCTQEFVVVQYHGVPKQGGGNGPK